MKQLYILLLSLMPLTLFGALLVNNGGGATNITSTSAWITATIVSTGSANPALYSYWGTNNGGTNANSWGNTNSYGVTNQGSYSFQATGLLGSTVYYFRTYASNSTEGAWASYVSQFITLTTPTSAPPSSVRAVTVDTNAMLKSPTNFFDANSNAIKTAIGSIGGDTNAVWGNISGTLANQLDLTDTVARAASALQPGAAGTWTNLSDYNNDIPGNSTNLSEYNNNAGFLSSNTGNWAGTWQGHSTNDFAPAGAATGTPIYVESDPVFSASAAYGIAAAATTRWDTAASDAASATGAIAVIHASTGAWTKAASDAVTATNAIPRITEIEARTNAWNAGASDASTATNETASLRGATNALDTRLTAHVTNTAPHVSTADRTNWNGKTTLADVAAVGYLTNAISDLSGWSTNRATGPVFWSSTRDGIDITSTGALSPDVSGRYLYSHMTNNFDYSAQRAVYVCTNGCMLFPGNFVGSDTYRICAVTNELPYIYVSSSTNPASVYTSVEEVSTGSPSGAVAVAASTNIVSIGQDAANPGNLVITGNLVVASVQLGTNTPATNWPVTDLSALNAATNAINARVAALEVPYQPWVSVIPNAGATATVTYAAGPLVEIVATNSPTTITFDNSAYPTSGVCAVNVEIYAGTNSIAFVSETITNSAAPTISTSDWTSVFYRKVGTNILWKGRN